MRTASLTPGGQRLRIGAEGRSFDVRLPLAGAFQASNALVAAGLCIAAGEKTEAVLEALEHIEGARGRHAADRRRPQGRRGLRRLRPHARRPGEACCWRSRPHATGRLIVVFGAGGDRDKAKRPQMGAIAAGLADVAIVTDDNPRSEDPAAIRAEIRAGASGLREIGDRREAIRAAAAMLKRGDVLVVAGKGHEQGQTIGAIIHPVRRRRRNRRRARPGAGAWLSRSGPPPRFVAATGGELAGAPFAATGVSIDTRTLAPGDLFVALAGERDGHDFVGRGSGARRGWRAGEPPGRRRGCDGRRHAAGAGAAGRRGPRAGAAGPPRRGDRLGRQDQRHPGDRRRPGARRPGPCLGEVVQQPHRRAADAGADAARHRARGVRDRHEPCRRDHPADPHGPPAGGRGHQRRGGAHRELRRRRDGRRPRQGRDLRGPGGRRQGGAERRQPLVRLSGRGRRAAAARR